MIVNCKPYAGSTLKKKNVCIFTANAVSRVAIIVCKITEILFILKIYRKYLPERNKLGPYIHQD